MWAYNNPVNVVFGAGAIDRIGGLIAGRDYALVTYGEPVFRTLGERVEAKAGPARAVIDNITPNPNYHMLEESCRVFGDAAKEIGVIVALGGGSTEPG